VYRATSGRSQTAAHFFYIADRSTRPLEGSAYYDATHGSPAQDLSLSYG
jgi:hypothetical protein